MCATLVLISVALSVWLLYRFGQVVFRLLIAIVMGKVIRPAAARLHSRGVPRDGKGHLVYLLQFTLFAGFALWLFLSIAGRAERLPPQCPAISKASARRTANLHVLRWVGPTRLPIILTIE